MSIKIDRAVIKINKLIDIAENLHDVVELVY